MPYCPKCGVEVNKKRKTCPLCGFNIPPIDEEKVEVEKEGTFPNAENIYREEVQKRKNIAFYTIIIVLMSMLGIFLIISEVYKVELMSYFITSTLAAIAYTFFLFGYIPNIYNYIGLVGTTIGLTYTLSRYTTNSFWFEYYALPIIILAVIDFTLMVLIFRKYRFKNVFIYIPVLFLIYITIMSMGIDIIISLANGRIDYLSWSLIVAAVTLPIALIMLGVYHKTPDRIKEVLKKRFHI